MELKKSPKADSNSKRGAYLWVGFIFVLWAVVAPFLATPKEHCIERLDHIYTVVEEQIIEITHQDYKLPEAPEKVEMKALADTLSNVKNDAKATAETVQADEAKEKEVADDEPLLHAEQMPTFQGGDLNMFRNWVQRYVRYPEIAQENGISGKVVVNFVIERDGSLTNIKVLYTPDKSLSDEVIRLLKQSPKWTPGRQGDKIVRVSYNLPVDFRVSNPLTVVEGQVVETSRQDQTPSEAPIKVEMKVAAGTPSVVNNDAKATAATVQADEAKEEEVADDEPLLHAEQMPTFQGGDLNMFRMWVQMNVRYPQIAHKKGIAGKVVVSFVIERDGSLTNIKVLNTPHKSLSDEVIRMLKQSPKWTPGRQNGKIVRVTYNLPVDFRVMR